MTTQENEILPDPKKQLEQLVIGNNWKPPKMYPDPSDWIHPYLRDFVIIQNKDLCSMQMDMFAEDSPNISEYNCSLGNFYIYKNADDFHNVIYQMQQEQRPVAVDIETNGLSFFDHHIRTVQVCNDGKTSHILLCEKLGNSCRAPLQTLLEKCPVVFQNGTFDLGFLLVFTGVFPSNYCFDTLLAAQILDAGLFDAKDKAFNLGSLSERYLGVKVDKSMQKSFVKEMNDPLSMEQLRYASNDTIATWRVALAQAKNLSEKKLWRTFKEIDMPCTAVAIDIKVRGVPVCKDTLLSLKEKNEPLCLELEDKISHLLQVSPDVIKSNIENDEEEEEALTLTPSTLKPGKGRVSKDTTFAKSHQQLLEAFHKLGFIDLESTSEGSIGSYFLGKAVRKVSNDEREIIRQKCEAAAVLLEHREVAKGIDYIVKGFLGKFYNPKTKCVHPNLNVCGSLSENAGGGGKDVATGRFCLAQGTLISMARIVKTQKPIERVVPGDLVFAFDKQLNLKVKKVLWSGKTGHKSVFRVSWKGGYLDCTPEHQIRLSTGKYIPAFQLKEKDEILSIDRKITCVEKITALENSVDVYDLEIEDIHNFFANNICVHNSSSNPNLQNCKAEQEWRDIFKAPEGYLIIKTDASQQEVRVMAEVSGDSALKEIYLKAGSNPVDIYTETAALVLKKDKKEITKKERACYKAVVLAIGYGASAKTISEAANISQQDAKIAIESYFKAFPRVKNFISDCEQRARIKGYLQNRFSGRRRHWDSEKLKGEEYKYKTQAANFLIQGGAADCGKKSLLLAYEKLSELGCRPLPPVHDEMVFLAPVDTANEALKLLSECMVRGSEYFMKEVPMRAEGAIGQTWQKEAGFCSLCKKNSGKPKQPEDENDVNWYYRKGFEDVWVRNLEGTLIICCDRCYIGKLQNDI